MRKFPAWIGSRLPFFRPKIIFAFFIFLLPISGNADPVTLTAFNYPPYMDESLPEKGLFCELVFEAYRAAGYDAFFQFYPLKRSTQYVIEGKALAQLGTDWNFPADARKNDVQSIPLFNYRVVGFYRKDRFKTISFRSLNDLQVYRIGVIRGSSDAATLLEYQSLNVEEVTTMAQMFEKVHGNRSDLCFAVELSGQFFIAAHYPGEQTKWGMTDDAVQELMAQVVFSKKYPDTEKYQKAFRQGVLLIRKNGVYSRVLRKYYGNRTSAGDMSRKIYIIPKE
jgi:polar amino acid transport system substrate-binding protein